MKKIKSGRYDVADAHRVAKWAISEKGNRLTLISAFGILILCGMLYHYLYTVLFGVAAVLMVEDALKQTLLWLAFLPLAFLLTVHLVLPLFYGVMLMARDMARREDVELFHLFRPFSNGALYRRCMSLSYGLTWRLGFVALVVGGTYGVTLYFFKGSLLAGILCALLILIELFVGLFLCTKSFSVLYFASLPERMPLRNARKRTRQLRRKDPLGALRYYAFFLPRILLGLATLGIYLLADVLPMMALTYFCDCEKREVLFAAQPDDKQNLEDIENHE